MSIQAQVQLGSHKIGAWFVKVFMLSMSTYGSWKPIDATYRCCNVLFVNKVNKF